jgi:hypothetical protein
VKKQDVLDLIDNQLSWYSQDIFSEPDLKKAAKVLKDNNMILDDITAHNYKQVLNVIKRRIIEEIKE